MPVVAPELADALVQAGELQILRLNQSFAIEGSENVWFVKTGRIDIFAVQLEGDEPTGPRSHFLLLEAGFLVFGMNFAKREQGYCFLLTGQEGTQLIQLRRDQLRQMAQEREYASTIGQLIDDWLVELSASVSRDIRPLPKADEVLVGGKEVVLPRGNIARARRGIVWIQ
jgi:hypothetical protein